MKKEPVVWDGLAVSVAFPNKGLVVPVCTESSKEPLPTGFSSAEPDTAGAAARSTADGATAGTADAAPQSTARPIHVKDVLPGQTVRIYQTPHMVKRKEGTLREVIKPAPYEIPSLCPHAGVCGGCAYQTVPYEKQLEWKRQTVTDLFHGEYDLPPVISSPDPAAYRNKMEFSFGDEYKDGPLTLGLHKRNAYHDIVPVDGCQIVPEDFIPIAAAVQDYFREAGTGYYNTRTHTGFLRHLVLRHSRTEDKTMVNLVTSSQGQFDADSFVSRLLDLPLQGQISGILHTCNDSQADVVQADSVRILYGVPDLCESLLGLSFTLSPFSFFQTNTRGAEALYSAVLCMAGDVAGKTVFDLYCGTGTISQIFAHAGARKVYGIELVPEAVDAARQNALKNRLDNCEFYAGDVLKLVPTMPDRPDLIILDPPRDGVHPKALPEILAFAPRQFLYISCKPTSLVRDLPFFLEAGYKVTGMQCVDMFPGTPGIETIAKLDR